MRVRPSFAAYTRGELEREHLVLAGVLTAAPIKRALRASFALHAAGRTQIFCF